MRRASVAVMGLVLVGGTQLARPAPAAAQDPQIRTTETQIQRGDAIRKVLPAVVSITTRTDAAPTERGTDAAGSTASSTRTYGSGFVIDPSGMIVTNYHVVKGAQEIDVTFSDGTWVPAHLLKATRLIDIAVLQVDVGHPLPAVTWGDSEKLQVGEPVLAVGNALDVGTSVSGGLVSALNRNIRLSPYDDFVQTDAAINHGNSGGPLVNMRGEVIGIDTAIFSPTDSSSGVGFAISSRGARIVVHQLLSYGWLRPGAVGIKVQQLTPQMSLALGQPRPAGSIIAYLIPGGAAEAAGLLVGDVILGVDGKVPADERALLRAIAETPIGQDVTFEVSRSGETRNIKAIVREWPRSQWEKIDPPITTPAAHRRIPPDLGLALGPVDDAVRPDDASARSGGVMVTSVAGDTDAAEHGLAAGDVILRVQDKPVANAGEAQAAIEAARAEKREFVLVLVDPKVHRTAGPEWMALRVSDN